jgi:hypothetical protein
VDWIPYGLLCQDSYRLHKRSSVVSLQELAYDAMRLESSVDILTKYVVAALVATLVAALHCSNRAFACRLCPQFIVLRDMEAARRQDLRTKGLVTCAIWSDQAGSGGHRSQPCAFCAMDIFFSAVVCPCDPSYYSCVHHVDVVCVESAKRSW